MKSPLRRRIPQRSRVFFGCEGESERGYAALLTRLLNDGEAHVHLDTVLLGGGDPLSMVETAERQLRHRVSVGEPYASRLMLLDGDRNNHSPDRTARALRMAADLEITLIWQEPCHEALVLRHLQDCQTLRPPECKVASDQLTQRWPEYQKPMNAARLAIRIDLAAVLRAAAADGPLAALLQLVGF